MRIKKTKKPTRKEQGVIKTIFLLSLVFDTEDRGTAFLRNVDELLPGLSITDCIHKRLFKICLLSTPSSDRWSSILLLSATECHDECEADGCAVRTAGRVAPDMTDLPLHFRGFL
jgi:hypothetical protein